MADPGVASDSSVPGIATPEIGALRARSSVELVFRSEAYITEQQRLSRAGSWAWNPATGELFWSREMFRIYGFDPRDGAPAYDELRLRVHPTDRPAAEHVADEAVRTLRDFDMSYRVILPDASITHIRTVGHPLLDNDGRLLQFVGTVVDVTEQRLADEAREGRAREAALRGDVSGIFARAVSLRVMLQSCAELLVRHLDVALARIWTVDRGSTVLELHASAGMYDHINGAHARVPVGVHKIGLIAQEQRPHITNDVAGDPRIHDKAWAAREALVSFAGYPLIVEDCVVGVMAMFSRHRLPEETLDALCSIASIVAQGIERKRADERLRRSEAYLAEGQRLSHTGSWAWNLNTDERYWSKEVFRIYGFEERESPPLLEEVLGRVHPDDQQTARRILEDSFREGTDFRFETRIRIPGRSQKWVETVGHPVRDERGHVVEFLGTDMDVSAHKRANRLLRRAIRARYAAALEERMRLARDMHDGLLQDITGIALQLRALLPHVRVSPESAAQRLEEILGLTERTSREARQAIVGMRQSQSSDDLVSAIDSAVRRVAEQSTLSVTVTVSGQARPVSPAIREAATAIAHEAVTNVVKHAGATSARVLITFRPHRLRVAVRDNGCGLGQLCDARRQDHFGIAGMRERALSLGAQFSITQGPYGGTVLRADFPAH